MNGCCERISLLSRATASPCVSSLLLVVLWAGGEPSVGRLVRDGRPDGGVTGPPGSDEVLVRSLVQGDMMGLGSGGL